MKFYQPCLNEAPSRDMYMNPMSMFNDYVSHPILPNYDTTIMDNNYQLVIDSSFSDQQYEMTYPEGSKDHLKLLLNDDFHSQADSWKHKKVCEWNGEDTMNWIMDTGTNKDINISRLSLCNFKDVRGIDLVQMPKSEFVEKIKPRCSSEDRSAANKAGEDLYEEVKKLETHHEQVVPYPVIERGLNYEDEFIHPSDIPQFIDLDNQKHIAYDNHHDGTYVGIGCDSGYDSQPEEPEYKMEDTIYYDQDHETMMESTLPVVVAKRPPGRPKGSGKKQPKRAKNVSVPEFLRDLLLCPDYCPKIIKWEDYAAGKFR